ncbi:MAG TPA: ATPase, T2SS/T4P/T4SS family, partial [Actinomycetes bacterium]
MTPESALVARVVDRLAQGGEAPTPAAVATALRAEGSLVSGRAVLDLVGAVRAELTGAGPLDELLGDPDVSDVLVNGPAEVWVDRGRGLEVAPVGFPDEGAVRRLAQRLAASAGRRLDVARPTVDARLADGTRLHAVLPPVSPAGTLISLRVSRRRTFTLADLTERGTVTPVVADVL